MLLSIAFHVHDVFLSQWPELLQEHGYKVDRVPHQRNSTVREIGPFYSRKISLEVSGDEGWTVYRGKRRVAVIAREEIRRDVKSLWVVLTQHGPDSQRLVASFLASGATLLDCDHAGNEYVDLLFGCSRLMAEQWPAHAAKQLRMKRIMSASEDLGVFPYRRFSKEGWKIDIWSGPAYEGEMKGGYVAVRYCGLMRSKVCRQVIGAPDLTNLIPSAQARFIDLTVLHKR